MPPDLNELGLMIVSCELLIGKLFETFAALSPEAMASAEKYLKDSISAHQAAGHNPACSQPYQAVLDFLAHSKPAKTGLSLVPGKPDDTE